ncbi:hypothetical protein HOO68_03275 [Candidatus Gracilibacteria bacterium]|nr:hypothetical protein [Candidatus Gracilibacteria bacterium]
MTIVHISTNPLYDDTRVVIRRILRLGNAIKRDVSRLVVYQSQESTEKTKKYILQCRKRIFDRLKEVDDIRNHKKVHNEEQWNRILQEALSQVYKHSDTPDIRDKLQLLSQIDQNDASRVGIHFLQMYMKIIARIPEDKIYLPFKP